MKYWILCLIAALTVGCKSADEPVESVRRTLLIYMETRNSLDRDADDDLREMAAAEIPADCRLLVYKSRYDVAPSIVEIRNGRETVLKTYAEDASAVDPEQMQTVLADVRALAPARSYGLVLWSHSSGWRQSPKKSRAFGLENSSKEMKITDLSLALAGFPAEFIVFDTCYMGCVEVAYELRNRAKYLVASVCEVPTGGMPYDLTLPALFSAATVNGLKAAVDATVDHYLASSERCPSTLSVIDLSRLDDLAASFAAVSSNPLPANYEAQQFSLSNPYRTLFFDLGQYLEALGGDPAPLRQAVIHERHTPMIWGQLPIVRCSGLSVFIPAVTPGLSYASYGYNSLSWSKL